MLIDDPIAKLHAILLKMNSANDKFSSSLFNIEFVDYSMLLQEQIFYYKILIKSSKASAEFQLMLKV